MPLWDKLFGTHWDEAEVQALIHATQQQQRRVPATVFLVHAAGLDTMPHTPQISQRLSMQKVDSSDSTPSLLRQAWRTLLGVPCLLLMAVTHKQGHFHIAQYTLKSEAQQSAAEASLAHYWSVDVMGFQYFMPYFRRFISRRIEAAVADADRLGVAVMGLGALNKAEFINRGGEDIIARVPLRQLRLIHGDTLTSAAVIARLKALHVADAAPTERFDQVVVTGATSKIARAVCLFLAQHRVRTHMITPSKERFAAIQGEALGRYGAAAASCLLFHSSLDSVRVEGRVAWIVLKLDLHSELPRMWHHRCGDVILDVVVPPTRIAPQLQAAHAVYRPASLSFDSALVRDHTFRCHYLERDEMFACHAEVLVHYLERKQYHDVGPVEVDRLDEVWQQARKHGFGMTGRRRQAAE